MPIRILISFLTQHLGSAACSPVAQTFYFLRCLVGRLTIKCASCGQDWTVKNHYSLYEQQAVEACPCPRCGAYTLCCYEPKEARPVEIASPVSGWRPAPLRS